LIRIFEIFNYVAEKVRSSSSRQHPISWGEPCVRCPREASSRCTSNGALAKRRHGQG
jgi:hypothetical protein